MALRLTLANGITIESDTPNELLGYVNLITTEAAPPRAPAAASMRPAVTPRVERQVRPGAAVPPLGYEVIQDPSTLAEGQEIIRIRGETAGCRFVIESFEDVGGEVRVRVRRIGDPTPGIRQTSRMLVGSLMKSYYRRIVNPSE